MAINKDFSKLDFNDWGFDLDDAMRQLGKQIADDLFIGTATGEELDRMANEAGLMRLCSHEWLEYVGLNECYSYCKHCDQKAVSDRK